MSFTVDGDAVPTREEVKAALPSLQLLEDNLASTLEMVDDLRNKIEKHKAWAAPARRVPEDVFSIVFLECSRYDWKAPLVLGAVCRRWRDIMLNTPRAWALLQVTPTSHTFHHKLLDLWLSRCGALKVHISLHPFAPPAAVRVICRHEQNIRCLSLFNNSKHLQRRFTELEELRLGPDDTYWAGSKPKQREIIESNDVLRVGGDKKKKNSLLNSKRFPKLLSLHLHSPNSVTMESISRKGLFPPLQKLHIHVSGPYWLRIIQHCADTLITLIVEVPPDFEIDISTNDLPKEITMHRLQHFAYNNFATGDPGIVPFPVLQTPVLECYEECNGPGGVSPLHEDLASVTSLVLGHPTAVDWSKAPRVTYIRLRDMPAVIVHEMRALSTNVNLCPDLSAIDCIQVLPALDERMRAMVALAMDARGVITGKSIKLRNFASSADYDLDPNARADHFMVCSIALSVAVTHSA